MAKNNNRAAVRKEINLNRIKLTGTIAGAVAFSHGITKKKGAETVIINFLRFTLEVPRLSGVPDFLEVVIPEDLWLGFTNALDSEHGDDDDDAKAVVEVSGRIQSYSRMNAEPGRNKLDVFVFAKSIKALAAGADENDAEISGAETEPGTAEKPNTAVFEGYLCKNPVIRETPLGRNIADLFIAVNRGYGASYIPVIMWGGNAIGALNLRTGDKLRLTGRFQSRRYWKDVNGQMVQHTVHEVSASSFKLLEN